MQPTLELSDGIWDLILASPPRTPSPMEEDLEDDEGLPPMQHQILAHRPHPNQMDYDWEPPVTVIPDSQPEDDWPEPLAVIPDSEDNESVRI
jgi:hypothetical protein